MVRLGYDSITTVLVTYIATQIGFASSWMNPFCVVVAQGIAGVPVLSGSGLRIVVWVIATLIGLIFTMVYASRVKKNPLLSRVHESDRFFREKQADVEQRPFTFGDWLVLIVLTAVMVCAIVDRWVDELFEQIPVSAMNFDAIETGQFSSRMPNSSPPSRARVSPSRKPVRSNTQICRNSSSPAAWQIGRASCRERV